MNHAQSAKSKLMCRRRSIDSTNPTSSTAEGRLLSTPTQSKQSQRYNLRNDSSPLYFQSTQEVIEDLDVVWDWNSPQSTKSKALKHKRTYTSDTVKVPLKRHVSHNQIQTCNKLKSELEALKNQLDCETKANLFEDAGDVLQPLRDTRVRQENQNVLDLEALFEDSSVEEELFLCSQRIEETLEVQVNAPHYKQTDSKLKPCEVICNKRLNFEANSDKCKTLVSTKTIVQCLPDYPNSSFDLALETFKDEDVDLLTQADMNCQSNNVSNCDNTRDNSARIKCGLDEIKSKRLQALAKLEARKKLNTSPIKYHSPDKTDDARSNAVLNETSPIKCSPEEIEQKRLQALAKLQAKRKQDVIEKNRQDALKRLEMNKKKRSLISRTHSH